VVELRYLTELCCKAEGASAVQTLRTRTVTSQGGVVPQQHLMCCSCEKNHAATTLVAVRGKAQRQLLQGERKGCAAERMVYPRVFCTSSGSFRLSPEQEKLGPGAKDVAPEGGMIKALATRIPTSTLNTILFTKI
jgi:hypothetical protein